MGQDGTRYWPSGALHGLRRVCRRCEQTEYGFQATLYMETETFLLGIQWWWLLVEVQQQESPSTGTSPSYMCKEVVIGPE